MDLGRGAQIVEAVCHYEGERYHLEWMEEDEKCFHAVFEKFPESGFPEGAVLFAAERISKEAPEGLADMPEGALAGNMISIPGDVADRLRWRLLPPKNIANEVPKEIFASSPEELRAVKAVARYSDGTCVEKRVDWCMEEADFTKPGTCQVTGRVHQIIMIFPSPGIARTPASADGRGNIISLQPMIMTIIIPF